MNELEALITIDDALSKVDDDSAKQRIIKWILDKYSNSSSEPVTTVSLIDEGNSKKKNNRKSNSKTKTTSKRSRYTPSISKELNLNTKENQSFRDFVSEKKPSNNYAKCTVSVYYLKKILTKEQVNINDVYTCFKSEKWRVPADIRNALQFTASQKGWLDTSNSEDIKLTTLGENLIEHDLPESEQ